jgi:hypothetical protein
MQRRSASGGDPVEMAAVHLHLGCNVRTPTLLVGLALLGKGQEIEEEVT